jgi:hypothetical protein
LDAFNMPRVATINRIEIMICRRPGAAQLAPGFDLRHECGEWNLPPSVAIIFLNFSEKLLQMAWAV